MKKIIFTLFLTIVSFITFGQEITYPKYYIQENDTLGVIFSVEQSNEIYNDKKKLSLYKGLRNGCDSLVIKLWTLKSKYESNEQKYTSLIDLYKENDKKNQEMILNRDSKIENLQNDLKKCDQQFILKNEQYMNDEKIIESLRCKQNWLLGGTIGLGVLSILFGGGLLFN